MHSWPSPDVPALPGQGLPLRLHDTSTDEVRPTAPGAEAAIYVCGITPYDATHIGHAATYIAFDLVQRVWLDAGHDVHYVQNVTDVDDPLLERAARDRRGLGGARRPGDAAVPRGHDGAARCCRRDALRRRGRVDPARSSTTSRSCRPPGAVYDVDGDLYFRAHSDARFGVGRGPGPTSTMLALFAERGGDPDRPGQGAPARLPALAAPAPGEPSWDSPFGRGRPGWHIECAAIALDHLASPLDVQGGGSDLAFPHHEMGASRRRSLTGAWPFARHYTHAGMVGLDGEKMSKSRGNLVFVSRLRAAGTDPAAIRLAILAHHYRGDWDWTDGRARGGRGPARALARGRRRARGAGGEPVLAAVRARLADDLDAPGALAAVDRWAEETRLRSGAAGAEDTGAGALVRDVARRSSASRSDPTRPGGGSDPRHGA